MLLEIILPISFLFHFHVHDIYSRPPLPLFLSVCLFLFHPSAEDATPLLHIVFVALSASLHHLHTVFGSNQRPLSLFLQLFLSLSLSASPSVSHSHFWDVIHLESCRYAHIHSYCTCTQFHINSGTKCTLAAHVSHSFAHFCKHTHPPTQTHQQLSHSSDELSVCLLCFFIYYQTYFFLFIFFSSSTFPF